MVDSKVPFNIIIVIFLVFSIIGILWLGNLGLESGQAYLRIVVVGVVFLLVVFIAKFAAKLDFWFELPINKSSEKGLVALIIGIVLMLLFFGISTTLNLNLFSPFLMTPLVSFSIGTGTQTFSALQAATSDFWTFFISGIASATLEEIILGFGFVLMGSLILGLGLRTLLKLDFGDGNRHWDFVMAILFSIIMFSVLHFFNGSYLNPDGSWNWAFFGYAAIFRAVLNILIYKFGKFGLLFGIGVHSINNIILLGSDTVLKALGTFPGGVILDAFLILLFFFGILSVRKLVVEGELFAKDFVDFD